MDADGNLNGKTKIPFERTGGRYELVMKLPSPPGEEEASDGGGQAAPFRRPER